MKANRGVKVLAVILGILFLASCVSKRHPRKCNGARGIKTNMGIM